VVEIWTSSARNFSTMAQRFEEWGLSMCPARWDHGRCVCRRANQFIPFPWRWPAIKNMLTTSTDLSSCMRVNDFSCSKMVWISHCGFILFASCWTDMGFFSQMLGLHSHPWIRNSSRACAHKLSFGQIGINASDTRCLLSHNEEWNASTLESWGTLQWTLLQDIRAHLSTDIDATL